MRPLNVARNMYLDYTTTQSIKFYNKGCEKLPGKPFNGKMLMTWLVQVQCLKVSISKPVYNKVYLQMDKSAKLIRKQLATLNYYMKNVAKGDVRKLCENTRELLFELNAAGETTNDL
jgi:hypothetical protein